MSEKNGIIYETEPTVCCTARKVLWFMVFFGFMINYNLRLNLNIAIVSMVQHPKKTNTSLTSECLAKDHTFNEPISLKNLTLEPLSFKNKSFLSTTIEPIHIRKPKSPMFSWNEKQQGYLLGAFFWVHWITQIPGGILAGKYGTKLVFGLSNLFGVLCSCLIPLAASFGYHYILILRVIQGFLTGFAWPSMHNMTAKWIPPNERSKFLTAYLGSSVGAALTNILGGFIIDAWGWEAVFYFTGIAGIVWFTAWFFLVFDSPAEHPRISASERNYIVDSLGKTVNKTRPPIPWRAILTSLPAWMNCLGHVGGLWGLFTLLSNAPIYFRFIHGWKVTSTGLLSGIPQLLRMLFAMIISQIGDYILKNEKMSRTSLRKLATGISTIGQGLCMLALAYTGCNSTAAIIFVGAAAATHGAVSTGVLASIVDNSPNYGSIVLGMANSLVCFNGFATPVLVGYFTNGNQTIGQWQKIYWIASGILIITGIFYSLFSSSTLQPWNDSKQNEYLPSEVELLNKIKQEPDKKIKNQSNCEINLVKKI